MEEVFNVLPVTAERVANGHLFIAGHDLGQLARQWGTPLYVFDAQTVYGQVESLRNSLTKNYPGEYEIAYASKAYLSLGLAKRLAALKLGLDVVSMGELMIARKASYPPELVHLHGNNKSEEEMRFALEWGIGNIVVDSLEELGILESLAREMNKRMNIWLRLTPGVDVDTHPHVQTGHPASKFGIPIEDGQASTAIFRAKRSEWLHLVGLHTHIGSQIFEPQAYRRALKMLFKLAEKEDMPLERINQGGGFGVPYTPERPEVSIDVFIQEMAETIREETTRLGWQIPMLVVEPGRWLVARAGVAVYTIGTTKMSSDGTYMVAVDGGMADNPRVALYDARYTATLVERSEEGAPKHRATLVGKFCESGDQLIHRILLPEVRRGELIAVPVAGAYQLSMASNYNLAMRPAVLWLQEGQVEVLQQREKLTEHSWWMSGE